MNNLEKIVENIRLALDARDKARETVLPVCRDAIRFCSQSIRAIHRHQFDTAEELLGQAGELIRRAANTIASCPDIGSGMLRDAQKEFAEGNITFAIVNGKELPEPAELSVDGIAYLNGLGEAVGEVRRFILDSMRKGDLSRGEELLGVMDDIYSVLVTIDYPDVVTGGLRRTTDLVRGVLERTRSDLTLSIQQKSLETRLESFK